MTQYFNCDILHFSKVYFIIYLVTYYNPHERTSPLILRRKAQKARFNRAEDKMYDSSFNQIYKLVHGLEKVNLSDKNKILRPNQQEDRRKHLFQLLIIQNVLLIK